MAGHRPHPYPDAIAPDSGCIRSRHRRRPEWKLPIPPLATPLASLAAKDFGSSVPPKPEFWAWLAATTAGWAAFAVALLAVSWVLYFIVWLFKTIFQDRPNLAGGLGEAIGNIVALILVLIMVTATLLTMAERKWSALMQDRVGPNRARLPIPGLSERPRSRASRTSSPTSSRCSSRRTSSPRAPRGTSSSSTWPRCSPSRPRSASSRWCPSAPR